MAPLAEDPARGPDAVPADDLLDSWKQIAAYLRHDVRTVIRWEATRGLPVHRLPGGTRRAVYARKSELEAWRKSAAAGRRSVPDSPPHAVAVLPFLNLTADKDNEYFADGLADEIITRLAGVSGLRVTARTSSFAFRGREGDVRKIGARAVHAELEEAAAGRYVSAMCLAVSHAALGHEDQGLEFLLRAEDDRSPVQGWAGRPVEARRALERLDALAGTAYVSPIHRAWVHSGLGEADLAFEWLDRGIDARDPHVLHLPVKPHYDSLRGDARFGALMSKLRLPAAAATGRLFPFGSHQGPAGDGQLRLSR